MYEVKTFTSRLDIFKTKQQLEELDEQINTFLSDPKVKKVVSVSDAMTTDDKGQAIGIVRAVAYRTGK